MIIDGININQSHFSAMSEDEAVKRMIEDGFVPSNSQEWAKKAYSLMVPKKAPDAVKPDKGATLKKDARNTTTD